MLLRFGVVIIPRNSLSADIGLFPLKDLLFKMTAMMINSLVPHLEIWEIRVQFWLKKEMKVDTEVSKSNYSLELMVTGRLSSFSLLTPSLMMDMVSLMVIVTAIYAQLMLANNNANTLFLNKSLMMLTVVVMTASKTVAGLQTDTPESTEIYLLSRL